MTSVRPQPFRTVSKSLAWLATRWRQLTAHPDAGSSTAEAALLTPLLVMLLLFVVFCGRFVAAQIDVDAAASSAARSGSLARTQPALRLRARSAPPARASPPKV